jgi:hypothetical protein
MFCYPHAGSTTDAFSTLDAISSSIGKKKERKKKFFSLQGPRKARHVYTVFLVDRLLRAKGMLSVIFFLSLYSAVWPRHGKLTKCVAS